MIGFDITDILDIMYNSSTITICIVQISDFATNCIGRPLRPFRSYTEQSWIFTLIAAV